MKCISEEGRVLKTGGIQKIILYSDFSSTGLMLWILHGFLKFKFFLSQEEIVFKYLESPGTKCYSNKKFKKILEGFSLEVKTIKNMLVQEIYFLCRPKKNTRITIFSRLLEC